MKREKVGREYRLCTYDLVGVDGCYEVNDIYATDYMITLEDGMTDQAIIAAVHEEFPGIFDKVPKLNDVVIDGTDGYVLYFSDADYTPLFELRCTKVPDMLTKK